MDQLAAFLAVEQFTCIAAEDSHTDSAFLASVASPGPLLRLRELNPPARSVLRRGPLTTTLPWHLPSTLKQVMNKIQSDICSMALNEDTNLAEGKYQCAAYSDLRATEN